MRKDLVRFGKVRSCGTGVEEKQTLGKRVGSGP